MEGAASVSLFGESDGDGGTLAGFALEINHAVVIGDGMLHDGKAESRAAGLTVQIGG